MFFISLIFIISNELASQSILGIDVSHYNGTINWTQVNASGKVFAWVKATEGVTYNDPNFSTNMVNGNNAGVVMGAYHFARPDNNSAVDDANHFLSVASSYIGGCYLPPVLDLEDPSGVNLQNLYSSAYLTAWIKKWMAIVENQTGVAPIIYTNGNYASYLSSSINNYSLWIANPGTSPTTSPTNIGNWTSWGFKQYDWYGTVSGISGAVDLNVFNGTLTDFNNLIGCSATSVLCNNDDCLNAVTLFSDSTCQPTLCSVDNAISDSFSVPSCDLFGGNILGAGVFFSFTPTSSTFYTITVTPTNTLDAVLVVYSGDCYTLQEIGCIDTLGGNGGITILNIFLTAGVPYTIRVYDYGSVAPTIGSGGFSICITNSCPTPILSQQGNYMVVSPINATDTIAWYYQSNLLKGQINDSLLCFGAGNYYCIVTNSCGTATSNTINGNPYTTEINETINANNISIYPNPTNGLLNIKSQQFANKKCKIILTNTFGQVINNREIQLQNSNEIQLDIQNLPVGIYFLLVTSNQIEQTFKILKQ